MAADTWGLAWGGTEGAWGFSWQLQEAPPPPPPVEAPATIPSGGHPYLGPTPKRKKDLPIEVSTVIREVAERQVQVLELDKQKRFDELYGELQVREIEWNSRYLTALNNYREYLIHQEIGRLLKEKQKLRTEEEEALIALLMSVL